MITPTYYIPIAGTWARDTENRVEWWEEDSDLNRFFRQQRLFMLSPSMPFEWSTNLDGIPFTKHYTWKYAGKALQYYIDHFLGQVPYANRNIIAHSHGMQVVLYAASNGVQIRNLVTVGSPVRKDMKQIALNARPNIHRHLHILDDRYDLMGSLGQLFDGNINLSRQNNLADVNDAVSGISHSKILSESHLFPLWDERGWLEFLAHGRTSRVG